jgi:hypothetical protein
LFLAKEYGDAAYWESVPIPTLDDDFDVTLARIKAANKKR